MKTTERAKAAPAWLASYPELKEVADPVWLSVLAHMAPVYLPAGTVMLRASDSCQQFALLLRGTVRVFVQAATGREMVLYRLRPGELCILSLGSLLGRSPYPADVVAETDVRLVTLSAKQFRQVFEQSSAFREYVIAHLVRRLHETMRLIQEIAFERLDIRLACYLCQRFQEAGMSVLPITHQLLAAEIGTTREVASRMLKELERRGCVRLHRGRIELASETSLRAFLIEGTGHSGPV